MTTRTKTRQAAKRRRRKRSPTANASSCGAGAPGRPGFQPGNKCAVGGKSGGIAIRQVTLTPLGYLDKRVEGSNEIIESVYQDIPESVKQRTPELPIDLDPREGGGAVYQFGAMRVNPEHPKKALESEFVHEYGHHVDLSSGLSDSLGFRQAFASAQAKAQVSLPEIPEGKTAGGRAMASQFDQLVGALTGGTAPSPTGMSHGEAYYQSNPGARYKEAFATAFNGWVMYNPKMRREYPELFDYFDNEFGPIENQVQNTYQKAVTRLNPLRLDPTKSATLRRRYGTEIAKRYDWLKKALQQLLVEEDAFGLRPTKIGLNVFCPTGEGGGIDPTCSPGGVKQGVVSIKLWRAADDDYINPDSTSFSTDREVAEAYLDNPNFGGSQIFEVDIEVPKEEILDLFNESDPIAKIIKVTGKPDPGVLGPEEWVPRIAENLQDKGISWVRVKESYPAGTETWMYVGGVFGDEPEMVPVENQLTENTRWRFLTKAAQVAAFKAWMTAWFGQNFLPAELPESDDFWVNLYTAEAYRRGMSDAYDKVQHPELADKIDFYEGTREEFLRSAFARPVSIDRLKLMAARTFDDLKGINTNLSNQLSHELTLGLLRGDSPRQTGEKLNKLVDGYKNRGLTIARTETVRALNEGQLDAMEALGVEEVGVSVEWRVSGGTLKGGAKRSNLGNDSPCPLCAPLNKTVWKLKEAHGMLPRHPNCMCSWIPAGVGEDTTEQKRSKASLRKAIERSISAERPKRKKRTIKEQRKRTKWAGADTKISKDRPEPIV